jgi:putative transposase
MRNSMFSETQIVGILNQVDGDRMMREVCREYGVSEAAYYQRKSRYGCADATDI